MITPATASVNNAAHCRRAPPPFHSDLGARRLARRAVYERANNRRAVEHLLAERLGVDAPLPLCVRRVEHVERAKAKRRLLVLFVVCLLGVCVLLGK